MNLKAGGDKIYNLWKMGFASEYPLELHPYQGNSLELYKIFKICIILDRNQLMIVPKNAILQKSFENNSIHMILTTDSELIFFGNLTSKIISVIILSTVVPFILAKDFHMLLFHGSGCVINDTACAFIGNKYSGKSTIVGYLAHMGVIPIADDMISLQVNPSCAGKTIMVTSSNKLRDSAKEYFKGVFYDDSYDNSAFNIISQNEFDLKNVLFLSPTNENFSIKKLSLAKGKLELITHLYDVALMDTNYYNNLMKWRSVSFYLISYPHDFTLISKVARSIVDILH